MTNDEQKASSSNPSPELNTLDMLSQPEAEEGNGSLDKDDEEDEGVDEDYQEETFPDESDEASEAKYQVGNEGISAVGDNARITINNYIRIVRVSRQRTSDDDNGAMDNVSGEKNALIEQALAFVRQSSTFSVNPDNKTEYQDAQLPADEEQISTWYYKLEEYEQCYTQAAAILHGAPAQEVSKRADSLYMLIIELNRQHSNVLSKTQAEPQREPLRPLPRNRSRRDLHTKTFTITQRVEGIERLFWRDVDNYGISSFGLRLLDFLAGEFTSKGAHGQDFREMLQNWSLESHQESSWRSAHALGVFLWHQNIEELRKVAILWAKNRNQRSWQRTALLLDGAYEIDSIKYPEKANDARTSLVLQILNEWVDRQKMQRLTDVNMGCAAANTYGLIGKRKPEVALHGLDQLQQFTSNQSLSNANALFASVASAYVSLSWSGHIQSVLTHLASIAEQSVLQRTRPNRMSERHAYRRQCEVKLNITLETFFLITADSLPEASPKTSAVNGKPLPFQPSISDLLTHDMVLNGLLAQDEYGWREQIITLLCAAIIERRNRSSAFDVIKQWAETVMKAQEEQSDEAKQVTISFKRFMISLGKIIDSWCLDLKERHGRSLTASTIYRNRLEQWHKREGAVSQLSQDVLSQLNG